MAQNMILSPKHYFRHLKNRLLPAIIGTAFLMAVVEAVLLLVWGASPPVVVFPSFVPMVNSLVVLTSFGVAFLSLGRHRVLRDAASYWIGMSYVVLGIGNVFYIFTWPGLLPGGQAVFGQLPSTSAWISMLGVSVLVVFSLVAVLAHWPGNRAMPGRAWLLSIIACICLTALVNIALVIFEQFLPVLVTATGAFTALLVTWEAAVFFALVTCVILSTRRYVLSNEPFMGYLAIGLVALVFASVAAVVGGKRYDLWWYFYRILGAVGFLAILTGLFSSYTRLFRSEQKKSIDLKERSEELRWETAFLEAVVTSSGDGILIIDSERQKVVENRRTIDIWKIPDEIISDKDDVRRITYLMSRMKNPQQFNEMIAYLFDHEDEAIRLEIELIDGIVLDTYSSPIVGGDGGRYGRIWTFRDITEAKRYRDMLENLSSVDGLTGLANRRYLDDALDREWRRAMRDGSSLSFILMDLDFFKQFNDNYGHVAGDDCLRTVAHCLAGVVKRPGDVVARYGGEEFACILPNTAANQAAMLAGTMRERLHSCDIRHAYSAVSDKVTMSFGIATLVPQRGQSSSDLVRLADTLLYSAKKQGRNQIRQAEGDVLHESNQPG
jgi:diguanylate cyclase (GGDEF)-like protein